MESSRSVSGLSSAQPVARLLRGLHVGSRLFQRAIDVGMWLLILTLMAYLLRQPDIWPSSNDVA